MNPLGINMSLDTDLYEWVYSEAKAFGIPAENYIRILLRQEMRRVQTLEAIRNQDLDVTLEEINNVGR